MTEDLFLFAFIGGIGLSVVAMIVAIWIQPRKGPGAWMMAASTVFFVLGVGGLAWIAIAKSVIHSDTFRLEYLRFAGTFGSLTLAVILFSLGFLWDRVKRSEAADSQ